MKEQTTVISTTVDGETRILMPITKLECVEDTATAVDGAADGDFIPIMDSNDQGQMKKISVQNLLSGITEAATEAQTTAEAAQTTADAAQAAAADAATAAAEAQSTANAAQSAAESVSSASVSTAFSVGTAAWSELAATVAGRGYSANISADGVTAADFSDVFFDAASIEAASDAEVIADTAAGAVVLYAKSIPVSTVSGAYFIRKGVSA